MCILFMYVANHVSKVDVSSSRSPYKLILASNRDEKFSRSTKSAGFWENPEDSHILAGQDMEELGTWLGISKQGKLAALLNIMSESRNVEDAELISRGSLVTGFLRSAPDLTGCTYLKNLCHLDISKKYKPFQLLTVDFSGYEVDTGTKSADNATCQSKHLAKDRCLPSATPASVCVTYLTNQKSSTEAANTTYSFSPIQMTPPVNTCKFYALGNSPVCKPFRKVECGKREFESLVKKHCNVQMNGSASNECLVEELLQFLKSTERYFPDDALEEQAKGTKLPKNLLPNFGARYVSLPGVDYGTRTHTIILVDAMNNVSFNEWTMKSPINPSCPEWSHANYTFTMT